MKLFNKDALRNPLKLALVIAISLGIIILILVTGFIVWNEMSPEGQEEFEHAATIYYYKSNTCSSDCLLYGRSVNTKKNNRSFLIDAIVLGRTEGGSIINGEIINPSIWQCAKNSKTVNSNTEPLQEGQHYDCFKVYNISTE